MFLEVFKMYLAMLLRLLSFHSFHVNVCLSLVSVWKIVTLLKHENKYDCFTTVWQQGRQREENNGHIFKWYHYILINWFISD
jgi:hypothetical protein